MNKIDEVLELLKQRECENEKPKNVILWVLAIVGAVAAWKKETPVPERGTGVFLSGNQFDIEGEENEKRRNLRGSRGKNRFPE